MYRPWSAKKINVTTVEKKNYNSRPLSVEIQFFDQHHSFPSDDGFTLVPQQTDRFVLTKIINNGLLGFHDYAKRIVSSNGSFLYRQIELRQFLVPQFVYFHAGGHKYQSRGTNVALTVGYRYVGCQLQESVDQQEILECRIL